MQFLLNRARSASEMTAAKVIHVIARLPDCDGQAADAVSALHPSKIGGRSQIAQNYEVRMSRYMDTSSTTQMAEILDEHWRSRGISWTKFVWTSLGRIVVGKTIRRSSLGTWMVKKVPKWECVFVRRKQGLFLRFMWMKLKWPERSIIWVPCGRNWWNMWILRNQHSFLDHVYLGCTQREWKPHEIVIE